MMGETVTDTMGSGLAGGSDNVSALAADAAEAVDAATGADSAIVMGASQTTSLAAEFTITGSGTECSFSSSTSMTETGAGVLATLDKLGASDCSGTGDGDVEASGLDPISALPPP